MRSATLSLQGAGRTASGPGFLGLLSSQTLLSNGASAGFWRTLQRFAHHRIIYSTMEPFLLYIMCEHKLWPVCPRLSRRQSRAFFIPATGGGVCRVVHGGWGTDHGMPSARLVDSADNLVKAPCLSTWQAQPLILHSSAQAYSAAGLYESPMGTWWLSGRAVAGRIPYLQATQPQPNL